MGTGATKVKWRRVLYLINRKKVIFYYLVFTCIISDGKLAMWNSGAELQHVRGRGQPEVQSFCRCPAPRSRDIFFIDTPISVPILGPFFRRRVMNMCCHRYFPEIEEIKQALFSVTSFKGKG